MERGTQIIYIPPHLHSKEATDSLNYIIDVEFGFVTEDRGDHHFCRFWSKRYYGTLRTISNSELVPTYCLRKYVQISQFVVDMWLEKLEEKKHQSLSRE